MHACATHLAIISCHVCICQYLHEHGAKHPHTKRRGAIPREAEPFAEEDEVGGSLLGCGEREELANLKCGTTEHAHVLRKDVVFVFEQPFCLCYCGLQERFVRATRWERVGVSSCDCTWKQGGSRWVTIQAYSGVTLINVNLVESQ